MSAEIPRLKFSREGIDETHTTEQNWNNGLWKLGSQPFLPSTPGMGGARFSGKRVSWPEMTFCVLFSYRWAAQNFTLHGLLLAY